MKAKQEPSQFFDRSKLVILTNLVSHGDAISFTELLELTEMTNGNLSSHLRKLEESKHIKITKQFSQRKPLTTVVITDSGRMELKKYLNEMRSLLEQVNKKL